MLGDAAAMQQAFYLLAPSWALWPLLVLATLATIIASQSAITGAFSVAAQAVQLGYLPRITVRHTSNEERGQIYAPGVNAVLCAAVVLVVLAFPSSTQPAAAFGFAVTATMVLTTLLVGFVIFRIWRWNFLWAAPAFLVLLLLDATLFAAAATKFLDGAWLPLTIAASLALVFTTWSRGRALLAAREAREMLSLDGFMRATAGLPRVPGMAIYLTRDPNGPPRAVLGFGFIEEPRVPPALAALPEAWQAPPMATSYILGRQILIPASAPGMARWREALFGTMLRPAGPATEYYGLPPGQVVELGAQVTI